ncbi:S9 family peptidase [bacterium]|nr:S9 family peptidase [bacterium]MBU1985410.1 S9 family peptidase [bacterium]
MQRILFLLLLLPALVQADTLTVNTWLTAYRATEWPLFADSADVNVLLDADEIPFESFRPRQNELAPTPTNAYGSWEKTTGDAAWPRPSFHSPHGLGYAVVYVHTMTGGEVKVNAACPQPFVIFMDGKEIARAVKPKEDGRFSMEETVTLERGTSLLFVKSVLRPDTAPVLYVTPPLDRLSLSFISNEGTISFTVDPRRTLERYEDFTLFADVSSPVISPDGRYLACIRSEYGPNHKRESWLEVWDLQRMDRAYTLRPAKGIGNLLFVPSRNGLLLYTTSGEDGSDIWSYSLFTGETKRVKRSVEGLVKIACTRGDPILYYTADEEIEKSNRDYQLFDELEDRLTDWTRTRALFSLNVENGVGARVTAIGDSFALDDFALSPDQGMILFTRRLPRLGRPYYDTEFWVYYPRTLKANKLATLPVTFETRPLSFTWLPKGDEIAFVSAAYLSEENDTLDHNLTQTALWIMNTRTGQVRNLTAGSTFSIEEDESNVVRWSYEDNSLWFLATQGGEAGIFRINPYAEKPVAERITTSRPHVSAFDLSAFGTCALTASSPTEPGALFVRVSGSQREQSERIARRAGSGEEVLIFDPNAGLMNDVEGATIEPWNFVNQDGVTIEGWLYYDRDLPTMSKTWPLIVYYYAGVSPRDLRWRFTYQWWVANGYVVYVLNPVGCVGYGPEFADKHSNDWGTLASRDIIEGVDKLLAAKPFLDAKRVGAYGGSYGGFITLDLATKTDRFAALASLSGISNITSYFGGGLWGFTYGDIALPRAYPWNRRDVYVEKSPIFHADKITTPLLLAHGAADVNVPTVESDQMFVALKLLGKNVAYVQFAGEDHIFAKHENRVVEFELLREWFDMHLKNEPAAWNGRWKK